MEATGFIEPQTTAAAREHHRECELMAADVVREVALALGIDGEAYRERVTDEVVRTAQDAIFGALLRVQTGTVADFDAATSSNSYSDYTVQMEGSEHVDGRAWHVSPCAEAIAVVSFDTEPQAAIATVRRQAYGRIYRPLLRDDA